MGALVGWGLTLSLRTCYEPLGWEGDDVWWVVEFRGRCFVEER